MNLEKVYQGKQINYRLTIKDRNLTEDLLAKLMALKEDYPAIDLNALNVIGMLWCVVEADNQPRRIKSRGERIYANQLDDYLNKHFNTSKYSNLMDTNFKVHVEMIALVKRVLVALHVSALGDEQLALINAKLGAVE